MSNLISDSVISNKELKEKVLQYDWEFAEKDTQYFTHNVHRYSGKYIPQIPRKVIELITNPYELILDPYNGSGTTSLEASLANRRSIGVDLNPLAILISKVKTTPISNEKLDELIETTEDLINKLMEYAKPTIFGFSEQAKELFERAKEDPRFNDTWFTKWFQPHVLLELIVIKNYIDSIEENSCRDLVLVAFSNILRKSSNAHSGYPNVMFDKKAKEKPLPSSNFLKSFYECVNMVRSLSTSGMEILPEIKHADSTNLPLSKESVDAIVTHPPYIGSVPYAEYGTLSLGWLGYDSKELDKQLTGGRRQTKDVVERFRDGYRKTIEEAYRVLKANRKMFLMVGNPVVKGEEIDLGVMSKELASEAGFILVVETTRKGVNRRANKMGEEYLMFFEKK
ncbi:DNA methyltransferase [Guptibacillus hwajinpoensis]|uniref:DNA methyltransferase n=1 Tax=Guptibacillus hwajinpoensis TaxID=208199 RepID=UPI001CFDEA74|nr:DNA methyltransferase [Pseudalkalibacillus hwajinpoensis]